MKLINAFSLWSDIKFQFTVSYFLLKCGINKYLQFITCRRNKQKTDNNSKDPQKHKKEENKEC